MNAAIDVRHLLPSVTVPTLVLHRVGDPMLVDRPASIDAAQPRVSSGPLADRVQLVAADLINEVPTGADIYVLKHETLRGGRLRIAAVTALPPRKFLAKSPETGRQVSTRERGLRRRERASLGVPPRERRTTGSASGPMVSMISLRPRTSLDCAAATDVPSIVATSSS